MNITRFKTTNENRRKTLRIFYRARPTKPTVIEIITQVKPIKLRRQISSFSSPPRGLKRETVNVEILHEIRIKNQTLIIRTAITSCALYQRSYCERTYSRVRKNNMLKYASRRKPKNAHTIYARDADERRENRAGWTRLDAHGPLKRPEKKMQIVFRLSDREFRSGLDGRAAVKPLKFRQTTYRSRLLGTVRL